MSDYTRLRTPFTSMSFCPDIPSNALGPNEYNSGKNIEADVRSIKKIFGEAQIASTITDMPIFMEGGFRSETSWVYIVATRNSSSQGKWWMITATGISNITPGVGANPSVYLSGYTEDINITFSWVGNVFFMNDGLRNPMYFLPTSNEMTITSNASWNYDVGVTSTTAGFVRNFCSPNVGNILIAGNLTKDIGGTLYNYPTTVRWSQAFANQGYPATWEPTLSNVANEQEVPVRGPLVDGFFLGGNFYVCSYWDTVVFSPISYQNSTAPIFGVRLLNQGRGLFNNNCWTNTDANVYGIDARDIWVFNGSEFSSLGNQKVKDYFFSNLSPLYSQRMFMVNNTQKYQIEIYYPDLTSTGWCNKMLSYRYDLQVWNAPKDIQNAVMGTEGPRWVDSSPDYFNLSSRAVVYARGGASNTRLIETAIGNSFINDAPIDAQFERTNIALQTEKGPVPYSSKVYIHRMLPEMAGTGKINVTVGGANSTQQTPTYGQTGNVIIDTDNPWVTTQQNSVRTVAVKFGSNDATDTWKVSALNLQATVTEDAF
jgi:hypothetical protein